VHPRAHFPPERIGAARRLHGGCARTVRTIRDSSGFGRTNGGPRKCCAAIVSPEGKQGDINVVAGQLTGTVTFLFTDIEGSTKLWERSPKTMQAALARHDELAQGARTRDHGADGEVVGGGARAPRGSVGATWAGFRWTRPSPWKALKSIHLEATYGLGYWFFPPAGIVVMLADRDLRRLAETPPWPYPGLERCPAIGCATIAFGSFGGG
jgi:class 3 adenylate cyclase